MKSKVALIVAVLALAGAVVVGGTVLLVHPGQSAGPNAGPNGTSSPTPTSRPTSAPVLPPSVFPIPQHLVNPLSAPTYCRTAKLLAIFTYQDYGLNKKLALVNGPKFDRRLKTIAAAYSRLADQASRTPKAAAAAAPWRAMAASTRAAEELLRVAGLQVDSQIMLLQLGKLAKVGQVELPKATATLPAACGFSKAAFGLR